MQDMDAGVDRIELALEKGENIMVYGDYDVDGTTSVALVSSYLKNFYPNVATYIPDRYEEGYGVSYKGIDFAADNDISLIIALDCGIKAIEKVPMPQKKELILSFVTTTGREQKFLMQWRFWILKGRLQLSL